MSDLLLKKIYDTSDMSALSTEGTKNYAVVCGLNCRKLKDNIAGHKSAQWKVMEEYIRDVCNIDAGYESDKGSCEPNSACWMNQVSMK